MTAPARHPGRTVGSRRRAPAGSFASRAIACLAPCCAAATAFAQPSEPSRLEPVTVTATRIEAPAFDVPASIDRIGGDEVRDARPQVNLSESLGRVPGLLARDRQNYAQDVQIAVRGFGARSTFGIRGVRLYVDGIPATLPDGQGQITHVDLGSIARIEVLRGPFSALYGNSSGGVIQVFSEEGEGRPRFGASASKGSDGLWRIGVKASGQLAGPPLVDAAGGGEGSRPVSLASPAADAPGTIGYVASGSRFHTDGYREHSAATRETGNVKLAWQATSGDRFVFVLNSVSLPEAQDPLGLTRSQLEADRRGVDPSATTFDTRKTIDQTQGGIVWEHRVDAANALRVLVYDGHRNTQQFQAIPVATQNNPLNPGGVIALGRDYAGTDLRWTGRFGLGGRPLAVVAGLSYDWLREHRQGYRNSIGDELGVQGALRRDETNVVKSLDPYAQASWRVAEAWTVSAGVRRSSVRFRSSDDYVVGPNPDDSGEVRFHRTLPVVGVLFAVAADLHLYATAGRGFETPTLNELAYRPNGLTGLNLALKPATSQSLEVGVKARDATLGEATLAGFQTGTDDEIVTLSNVGGRSTFQNAGRTRRRGVEAAWSASWPFALRSQVALTWIDARYRDGFLTCTATPCPAPTVAVAAGNRIPGIARWSGYAALDWLPANGPRAGLEARTLSSVRVNDVNSDAAGGYTTLAAHAGWKASIGGFDVDAFVRVDDALNRRYVGSVIVNEGNSRFFEPAPRRTWAVGVSGSASF